MKNGAGCGVLRSGSLHRFPYLFDAGQAVSSHHAACLHIRL
jgi:hypothetical protein